MNIIQPLDLKREIRRSCRSTLLTGIGVFAVGLVPLLAVWPVLPTIPLWASILIVVLLGALALVGALLIVIGLVERLRPERHQALRWVGFGTPEKQRASMEEEWNERPDEEKYQAGPWYLTRQWVIHRDGMLLETCPTYYIAWVYLKRATGADEGKAALTIWSLDGHKLSDSAPVEDVDSFLLDEVYRRAPWAFYCYSEELQHEWTTDRAKFAESVWDRYQQVMDGHTVPQPLFDTTGFTPADKTST